MEKNKNKGGLIEALGINHEIANIWATELLKHYNREGHIGNKFLSLLHHVKTYREMIYLFFVYGKIMGIIDGVEILTGGVLPKKFIFKRKEGRIAITIENVEEESP